MFYYFLKIIIFPFIKYIWVGEINGLNNIPSKGGVIIAANHSSYFDFITLYSISPKRIYFLTGEIFFKKKHWSWIMKLTKQIKVDRNSKDKSESLITATNYLTEGKIIGMFPEGTRSLDGKLQKAYNGAIKLSITAGVPIIPVGIEGTFEILSKFNKFPNFKKCKINFGQPKYYTKDKNDIENYDQLTLLTKELMRDIGYLC